MRGTPNNTPNVKVPALDDTKRRAIYEARLDFVGLIFREGNGIGAFNSFEYIGSISEGNCDFYLVREKRRKEKMEEGRAK